MAMGIGRVAGRVSFVQEEEAGEIPPGNSCTHGARQESNFATEIWAEQENESPLPWPMSRLAQEGAEPASPPPLPAPPKSHGAQLGPFGSYYFSELLDSE